jgi:hypothetical protein
MYNDNYPLYDTIWISLENISLVIEAEAGHNKSRILRFPLPEISRIGKSIQRENKTKC